MGRDGMRAFDALALRERKERELNGEVYVPIREVMGSNFPDLGFEHPSPVPPRDGVFDAWGLCVCIGLSPECRICKSGNDKPICTKGWKEKKRQKWRNRER